MASPITDSGRETSEEAKAMLDMEAYWCDLLNDPPFGPDNDPCPDHCAFCKEESPPFLLKWNGGPVTPFTVSSLRNLCKHMTLPSGPMPGLRFAQRIRSEKVAARILEMLRVDFSDSPPLVRITITALGLAVICKAGELMQLTAMVGILYFTLVIGFMAAKVVE